MKLVYERTFLKILVDRYGILLGLTTKKRAYFFFVTSLYVGIKVGPTTDPYPGIVEVCGYDISRIVRQWDKLYKYMYMVSKQELKRRLEKRDEL